LRNKINTVSTRFSRYLYSTIDTERQLTGIKGARGSGKTTLLLQLLKISLFFLNQVSVKHKVTYPKVGDFMVNKRYLFEVGGKSKTQKQVADIKNAFVVADDIEYGFGNKIPLWLFGFLY